MHVESLGRTPSHRIGLGTVQFGLRYGINGPEQRVAFEDAKAIVAVASRSGISLLDTAHGYGDSEERLGRIGVGDWALVSKIGGVPSDASQIKAWSKGLLRISLDRLKADRLYGLLLHKPGELLGEYGAFLYDALLELKAQGLVEKIGVSVYDEAELDAIFSKYEMDLVQAPFSIVDRRLVSSGCLRDLSANGVEVHVRSVFLQGLLLMKSAERPEYFDQWAEPLSAWDRWIAETHQSRAGACLRFALSFQEIGKVVVGVDSTEQLNVLLEECGKQAPSPPDELASRDVDLVNPSRWKN